MGKHVFKISKALPDEYTVDHSMDPPYDCSGEFRETGVIGKPEFKNVRFSDFVEMYNGETTASFCSGCGFFHEAYSEDVDRWILDAAFAIQDEVIKKSLFGIWPELENDADALEEAVFDIRDKIDGDTLAFEAYSILPIKRASFLPSKTAPMNAEIDHMGGGISREKRTVDYTKEDIL
ncbi:MAG: hypothetical protein LIO92_04780 [Clostridiales bacterium]|nr:hypothetical protein [Clostridiales bacterium]